MSNQSKFTLRIILLFTSIIFASFIPEFFPDFFGDWQCEGTLYDQCGKDIGCQYKNSSHEPTTHYGFRHWVWILMGIIITIYNVGNWIDEQQ